MSKATVAVVQMDARLADPEANLVKMGEIIGQVASRQPVDLILFPELSLTGYECAVRFFDLGEVLPGRLTGMLAERARRHNVYVAFGIVAKHKVESTIYNAMALVGPDGELIGAYHKVHLLGEERLIFRAGYKYPVFETRFGLVGLMLGWDLAFPEVARSYALQGADLVCLGAAWDLGMEMEWNVWTTARAMENQFFLAAANRVGQEPSYTFCGQSKIVGPRGEILAAVPAQPPVDEEATEPFHPEGVAVATVDFSVSRRWREELGLFPAREPRSYRELVKMY